MARWLWLTVILAAELAAADLVWKSKPAAQWTEEDAKQVLTASPWVKEVKATITRRLNENQLREGGQMGQPHGVGNEGVDPKTRGPKISLNAVSIPQPISLTLCWESALPVRLAELKSHKVEPPTLEGEGYRMAVYGVPGADFEKDPKQLGDPLKKTAALKREGKRDVKPLSVEVFQRENGLVVVYLFPLSAEINTKDRQVRFEAQIGRVVVAHTFDLTEMEFLGKLEL